MIQALRKGDLSYFCSNPSYFQQQSLKKTVEIDSWDIGYHGNLLAVQYFYYLGVSMSRALSGACSKQQCDVVDWLLEKQVPLLDNILIYPCTNGNINLVHKLIQTQFSQIHRLSSIVNQNQSQTRVKVRPTKDFPFLLACENGYMDIVLQLYLYGYDIHQRDLSRRNGIFHSVNKFHIDIVQWLLSMGVQCLPDNQGWTPLHLACLHNSPDAVRLLLPHCQVTKTNQGHLPRDLTNNTEILTLLLIKFTMTMN